jgi:hypothetical protein
MNKEQKKIIRKFERWQDRKFASNAKKGYRFFQPDTVAKPTPRSAYEAWGATYTPQAKDDRRQEKYMTWTIYAFVVAYIAFLIWREYVSM